MSNMSMSWFRRQSKLSPQRLGCDFHNHLLPGVDDGVSSNDEAFEAIEALIAVGYQGAVITPHIYPDAYDNTETSLRAAFDKFQFAAHDRFPDFPIALSAEYLLDDDLLRRMTREPENLLTCGGDHPLILVELPVTYQPAELEPFLEHARTVGIRVVLAHVERYEYLFDRSGSPQDAADRLRRSGVLIQMNLGSPVGRFGSTIQKRARALWSGGFVDILGSDLHQGRGAEVRLRAAWKYLARHGRRFDDRAQRQIMERLGGQSVEVEP